MVRVSLMSRNPKLETAVHRRGHTHTQCTWEHAVGILERGSMRKCHRKRRRRDVMDPAVDTQFLYRSTKLSAASRKSSACTPHTSSGTREANVKRVSRVAPTTQTVYVGR